MAQRRSYLFKDLDTPPDASNGKGAAYPANAAPGEFRVEDLTEVPYTEANLISSLTDDGTHLPVLDIDVDCALVPSSTSGHAHLYLDVELSWDDYVLLLNLLAKLKIIELGFANAAVQRKMTLVRRPGVFKSTVSEDDPARLRLAVTELEAQVDQLRDRLRRKECEYDVLATKHWS